MSKQVRRNLAERVDELEGNGTGRPYSPEDFRTGNYDPTDYFTPLTFEAAQRVAEASPRDVSAEEIHEESVEKAVEHLENDTPGWDTLTTEEKNQLDDEFDVEPDT